MGQTQSNYTPALGLSEASSTNHANMSVLFFCRLHLIYVASLRLYEVL